MVADPHSFGYVHDPYQVVPYMRYYDQLCPVCEGRGVVSWDPAMPMATSHTSSGPWTCPKCEGRRTLPQVEFVSGGTPYGIQY